MKPVLFELFGRIPIHSYGLLIVLGYLAGTWVAAREARKRGLPDCVHDVGMVMLLAGIVGGRVFYCVQFYDRYFANDFWEVFKIWRGGLVFYGGAMGGILGGILYVAAKRLPLWATLDVMSLGVPIGMALGRVGCFLNGCCFGRLCAPEAVLGVEFPRTSGAHESQVASGLISSFDPTLPVHPVQLYQAVHDTLLFVLLRWILRRPACPTGVGMPLLFSLYGVGRFVLEELRGDHERGESVWTISQAWSAGLLAVCLPILILFYFQWLQPRGRSLKEKREGRA